MFLVIFTDKYCATQAQAQAYMNDETMTEAEHNICLPTGEDGVEELLAEASADNQHSSPDSNAPLISYMKGTNRLRIGGQDYFKKNSGRDSDLYYCKNRRGKCRCAGSLKKYHSSGHFEETTPHSEECIARGHGTVYTQANGHDDFQSLQKKMIEKLALKPELTAEEVYVKVMEKCDALAGGSPFSGLQKKQVCYGVLVFCFLVFSINY